MRKSILVFLLLFFAAHSSWSQIEKMPYDINGNSWFENIKIGGYVQTRYNRLLETNPDLD